VTRQVARVVTLSASYGAGGSVIGPRLAQRLDLPFADRLIPARDPLGEQMSEEEREQSRRGRFLERLAQVSGGLGLPVPDTDHLGGTGVRDSVAASFGALAAGGGAVVLGRAGAAILGGEPGVYHVRLDGPEPRRIARAMALERIDEPTARARCHETDSARTRYWQRLYGLDPADTRHYHLVIDSTVLPSDACVDMIAIAANAYWQYACS
jgi:cytidylate kinase-like protein